MALYLPDGVTTSYHRIQSVVHTVNHQNSVVVLSYASDAARDGEKSGVIAQPYQKAVTYETAYDESMTPAKAYDFLKTLPDFEGATDV